MNRLHKVYTKPTFSSLVHPFTRKHTTHANHTSRFLHRKHAVRGVSLACPEGERFGLLGINGAGKTTTLGVLTGELSPSAGQVWVGGKSLSDPATQRMLGYCPQVDPLLDLMNAYETLWFFGRIRGIDEERLRARVDALVEQTGLRAHASRPCGTYSGGNKRKLSLAVALIGDPKVLLLDEPSTGMDPEARRHMWNVIQQVSGNHTVILVSHLMEEIEALCTRVGVMVSGRLQCLGSVQHLKGKFGGGYEVEVRCHVSKVEECMALCKKHLVPLKSSAKKTSTAEEQGQHAFDEKENDVEEEDEAELEEQHGGFFKMRVAKNIDLARAFEMFEKNKAPLQIYDYSISQFTLEQVFIKFAKEQEEEPQKVKPTP